jgi:hypothetical protein
MEFGFITWWFEKHFIWSTLLTPGMTLAWCFYKGLVLRGIVSGFLVLACMGRMGACLCHRKDAGTSSAEEKGARACCPGG